MGTKSKLLKLSNKIRRLRNLGYSLSYFLSKESSLVNAYDTRYDNSVLNVLHIDDCSLTLYLDTPWKMYVLSLNLDDDERASITNLNRYYGLTKYDLFGMFYVPDTKEILLPEEKDMEVLLTDISKIEKIIGFDKKEDINVAKSVIKFENLNSEICLPFVHLDTILRGFSKVAYMNSVEFVRSPGSNHLRLEFNYSFSNNQSHLHYAREMITMTIQKGIPLLYFAVPLFAIKNIFDYLKKGTIYDSPDFKFLVIKEDLSIDEIKKEVYVKKIQ